MADFLTGKDLFEEVYDTLYKAEDILLLVSPYIKLDDYFKKEIFDKHKNNPELHIRLVFGKNEKNPSLSFNKIDFEYFKGFPNITIVYVPNLHAKYYANERKGIITSINLYDYSFKNNLEFGVVAENKLIGSSVDQQAWDKTMELIKDQYCVFVRVPTYKKKLMVIKNYICSETQLDLTNDLIKGKTLKKYNLFDFVEEKYISSNNKNKRVSREEFEEKNRQKSQNNKVKYLSASSLGSSKKLSFSQVVEQFHQKEYITDNGKKILQKGKEIGLKYKYADNGAKWIVYPDFLINELN